MNYATSALEIDSMDPADKADFGLDFSEYLNDGDTIASVDWSLSSAAIAEGVEIAMQSHDDTVAVAWFQVASGSRSRTAWNGAGTKIVATCVATTAAGARWERAITITIKQRNVVDA